MTILSDFYDTYYIDVNHLKYNIIRNIVTSMMSHHSSCSFCRRLAETNDFRNLPFRNILENFADTNFTISYNLWNCRRWTTVTR